MHAPDKSPKARLVSMADKLYNLRDLTRVTPEGWSQQRVQEYFEWAGDVVRAMRDRDPALEDALEEVLQTHGVSLKSVPAVSS